MRLLRAFLVIITAASLAACRLEQPVSPPPADPAQPTPAPAFTDTPAPTATPEFVSLQPLEYYLLSVEYTTTADWSNLNLLTPGPLLTWRIMETIGAPQFTGMEGTLVSINQPLEAAQQSESLIGVRMEWAIRAADIDQPMQLRVQKGSINTSIVRVTYQATDGTSLTLGEFVNTNYVPGNTDYNPLDFTLDLTPLSAYAPLTTDLQRVNTPKMLWAFYYPWYDAAAWQSEQLKDHPSEPYDSLDPAVITRQVDEAQSARVDGFISSWWGPSDRSDQALGQLLDIAAQKGFAVSVYFETLTDSGPRDAAEIESWLRTLLTTHAGHPAFYRWQGKPLIVVWASESVPLETWTGIFQKLEGEGLPASYIGMGYNPGALDIFSTYHQYGVLEYENLAETYQRAANTARMLPLLEPTTQPRLWIATVQPGYDEQLIPGRTGRVVERDDGAVYRATWEAALASQPDWVFITTWNEWWENTHIEASQNHGNQYLDLTREYARQWKGN